MNSSFPHQRIKLAPNTYNNNNGPSTSTYGAQPNHNSFFKSQIARIYSTCTAEEPQWLQKERRRENDPDAGSPQSCDNTINTSTESKYDDDELEAAIEAFAWFKGEQRATIEARRLRVELGDALMEVERLKRSADAVTADMARLQMEIQRAEDRHAAASPMPDPSPSLGETIEELSRVHAHAEALWLKEQRTLREEVSSLKGELLLSTDEATALRDAVTVLRENNQLLQSREEALRRQSKRDFSAEVAQLEMQLRAAREAAQSCTVSTVDELNRLQGNHDVALTQLESMREELKLAQEECAWLRADKDIADEGSKVKAKIIAAAEAARLREIQALREELARLQEELEARPRQDALPLGEDAYGDDESGDRAGGGEEEEEKEEAAPAFASQYALAVTLQERGQLAEAVPPCREALAGMRASLGDDDGDTLHCMNTLATLLYGLGEYTSAEPLAEECLHRMCAQLGERHESTLTALVNLGVLLQALKQPDRAEALFRQFFDLREGVLEDAHPDSLRAMNSLSLLLQSQGKVAEAEPYCRRSLQGMRATLGEHHPDTLQSISNLAMLLYGQGKLEAAEPYCYEALSGMRTSLGNSHMSTLASISNLAMLLQAQRKLESAEPYCREALAGMRNTLGNTHSITLASASNLAMLLYNREQYDESEDLYREAFETMRDSLGADDPNSLAAMSNLAMLLQARGQLDVAAELFRECMNRRQLVLGDTHPDTIRSLNSLACLLQSQGKVSEAEDIYREAFVLVKQRAEASAAEEVERFKERLSEAGSQSDRSDDVSGRGRFADYDEYVNFNEEGMILRGTLSSSTLNSIDSGDHMESSSPEAVAASSSSRRGGGGPVGSADPGNISNAGDSQSVLSCTSSTARMLMLAAQSPKQVSAHLHKGAAPPLQLIKCAHDKCRKKFTSKERYVLHLKEDHKDSGQVAAELLKRGGARTQQGPQAKSAEHPEDAVTAEKIYFGCKHENCLKIFKNVLDRNTHEREVHMTGDNCNTSISSISSSSTGTSPLPDFTTHRTSLPSCPDRSCRKTFKSTKDRNNHMKDAHGLVMHSGVATPPPGLALFSPRGLGTAPGGGAEDVVYLGQPQASTGARSLILNSGGVDPRYAASSFQGKSRTTCPFAGCSKQCKSDAGLIDHIRQAHSEQVQQKQPGSTVNRAQRSPDNAHKNCNTSQLKCSSR